MIKNSWENNNTLLRESGSDGSVVRYYIFYSRDNYSKPDKEFKSESEALDFVNQRDYYDSVEKHTWYDSGEYIRNESPDLREIIWKRKSEYKPSYTEEEEYWSRPSVIEDNFKDDGLKVVDYGEYGKTHAYYIDCHYDSKLYKKLAYYFKKHGIQPIYCMCSKPGSVGNWMSNKFSIGYRKVNNEEACTLCRPNLREL